MRKIGILWVSVVSLVVVGVVGALVTLAVLSGNTQEDTTSPTISAEAQDIVAKSVSAMAHVNSCRLDTDVLNTYKVLDGPNQTTNIAEWNGTRLIDISRKEMKMDMTIGQVYFGSNQSWSIEMYLTGGYEYCKATSSHVHGGLDNPWDRTRLTEKMWTAESQISYYIELLKTGSQANMLGSENITGIDCYILTLTPSTEAIIDWVTSQDQPVGPSLGVMFGGAISVVRADAYQGGSVKLWVDKDNYLPLKAEINAVFYGFVGGGAHPVSPEPYIPTTGHVNSSFDAQATFSGYNQPVSIQLPQEALNDQGHIPPWVWASVQLLSSLWVLL